MDKKYFDAKIEVMVPATITYRILAETAEEAMEIAVKGKSPVLHVDYKLNNRVNKMVKVYDAHTINIHLEKKL